ncbi:MAG TPA: helix-turn-helix transcriptional regulator [Pyrinomonadaceae bacterium]|nr:helix-turn-helix transcriptional regulator [Pyrinomonadaceae bacterium]
MARKPRPKPKHLAAKLLALRRRLGVTQVEMAKLLEVPAYCRLSEYESGRREPNLLVLLKYARLARVTVECLIDDELELPPSNRWASTNDPKVEYKYPPCPGCGAELEKDAETGRYLCGDCDSDWEAWEVMDSTFG